MGGLQIELGLPSEKRLKKACGRSQQVIVYTYGSVEMWWKQMQPQLARFKNISVYHLQPETTEILQTMKQRNLEIQVSIQDQEVTWHSEDQSLSFIPEVKVKAE